jgi:hypothetical protein
MTSWNIRYVLLRDGADLAEMRTLLWPESSIDEQEREVDAFLAGALVSTTPLTNSGSGGSHWSFDWLS